VRRATYPRDGVDAWWQARSDGIQQGWTVYEGPRGDGPVVLTTWLDGASGLERDGDCNDGDGTVNPGATETIADGVDSDCDGAETCYVDADDDGWRLTSTVASADDDCTDAGEALDTDPTGDCDDTSSSVFPGASEVVGDEIDQDCDGEDATTAGDDTGGGGGGDDGDGVTDGGDDKGDGSGCSTTGRAPLAPALPLLAAVLVPVARRRRSR